MDTLTRETKKDLSSNLSGVPILINKVNIY